MENEKNKIILISVILILLFGVIITFVYVGINTNKNDNKVTINQIYSSDYELNFLGNDFYYGTYKDRLGVIIDSKGKEIYKNNNGLLFENIYELKNNKYLIYNNDNNELNTYIFNGSTVEKYYNIKEVENAKPVLYVNDNNKYLLAFIEQKEANLYIYNLDNKGIIVLQDTYLNVSNKEYITINDNSLIIKKDNKYGAIDLEGNIIIEPTYNYLSNDSNGNYIALNDKEQYGIIDKENNILLNFNYKKIYESNTYYLVVNNKNKLSLFDSEIKDLLNFRLDYNDSETQSVKLYKIDNNLIIINNYNELENEYKYHNLYFIKDNKINKTINEYYFDKNELIYTIDKDNKIVFYDYSMNEINTIDFEKDKRINSIEKINNNLIRINYTYNNNKNEIYYNKDNNVVKIDMGEKLKETSNYVIFKKKLTSSEELTIYDLDGNRLNNITGKSIKLNNSNIIIDNSIYEIIIN